MGISGVAVRVKLYIYIYYIILYNYAFANLTHAPEVNCWMSIVECDPSRKPKACTDNLEFVINFSQIWFPLASKHSSSFHVLHGIDTYNTVVNCMCQDIVASSYVYLSFVVNEKLQKATSAGVTKKLPDMEDL